jgi:hypothetical protein
MEETKLVDPPGNRYLQSPVGGGYVYLPLKLLVPTGTDMLCCFFLVNLFSILYYVSTFCLSSLDLP